MVWRAGARWLCFCGVKDFYAQCLFVDGYGVGVYFVG